MNIHNIYIYTCWNLEKPSSEFLGNLERTVAQYMRDNDLPGKAVVLLEHDIMTDPVGLDPCRGFSSTKKTRVGSSRDIPSPSTAGGRSDGHIHHPRLGGR